MILRKTWLELRVPSIVYLAVMQAILLPAIQLWHDMQLLASKLSIVLPMTRSLSQSRLIQEGVSAMLEYPSYYAVHAFFKGGNICGAAAAVLLGTALISRERETGTLEFLLSRPIGRSRILAQKSLVAAICVVVPVFLVSWSGIPLSAWINGEELGFLPVTLAAWHNAVFLLGVLALTILCSVVFRTQALTATAVGCVVIVHVTIYMIQTLRSYSLFHLVDIEVYSPILKGETGAWQLFVGLQVWMLLGAAALYVLADRLFRRLEP